MCMPGLLQQVTEACALLLQPVGQRSWGLHNRLTWNMPISSSHKKLAKRQMESGPLGSW